MSHFTVLVIGNDPEKQLEPFEESPESDKYIEFKDCTEQVIKEWDDPQETVKAVQTKDGEWVSKYSDKAKDCKALPEAELPVNQVYKNMYEFITEYHGYSMKGNKYGYYFNPNAKWDWYVLGGRWKGSFKIKENEKGVLGESGAFGNEADKGYVDQLTKGQIDIEGMKTDAEKTANEKYTKYEDAVKGVEQYAIKWDELRKGFDDIEEARFEWRNNPWVKAMRDNELSLFMDDEYEYWCVNKGGRSTFVKRAINSCLATFAILHDGKWYERGDMGWWGMVSDEKDQDEWNDQFMELFNSLPDDTLLSIYDCHI